MANTLETLSDVEDAITRVRSDLRAIAYFLEHIEYSPHVVKDIDSVLLKLLKIARQIG